MEGSRELGVSEEGTWGKTANLGLAEVPKEGNRNDPDLGFVCPRGTGLCSREGRTPTSGHILGKYLDVESTERSRSKNQLQLLEANTWFYNMV